MGSDAATQAEAHVLAVLNGELKSLSNADYRSVLESLADQIAVSLDALDREEGVLDDEDEEEVPDGR